jgi:hypothetical protein
VPKKSEMMHRHSTLGAGRDERGVAMVELALVLPVLVTLILGLFSSAMIFDGRMQLTHAAREGSRHAATLPETQPFVSGTWATHVRSLVIEREGGRVTPAGVCVALVVGSPPVAVSPDHTTAPGSGSCFDDSSAGVTERRVQVTTRRTMRLDTMLFSRDVDITARATMRHETNS